MHAHPAPGAKLEVAQVFRRFAAAYRKTHVLCDEHERVLRDLERCRTDALGGHRYRCTDCGRSVPLYNSCLNRHCPTCQGPAQYHWIEQRERRLLDTAYFHVVFTLPARLRPMIASHRKLLFDLLFRTVAETLKTFGADSRRLGAELGFTLVLHTWTRELLFHPHIHAIVSGGGLSFDGGKWLGVPNDEFLFPVRAVSRLFRGKFLSGFIALHKAGRIHLTERESRKLVDEAKEQDWVVFAKKPFGGPAQILNYLGRYTHRIAISSARMISIGEKEITFRTRGANTCTLSPDEFIRRFLLHVLPHQFFKIRHYGLLAPGNVNTRLRRAQELLAQRRTNNTPDADRDDAEVEPPADPNTDRSAPKCPHCGGRLAPLTSRNLHIVEPSPPDTS